MRRSDLVSNKFVNYYLLPNLLSNGHYIKLKCVIAAMGGVGFERDEGKVLIHRGIEGQGINIPFPFTLYYQGGGVLPLSRGQKMFSTRSKV